MEISWVRVMMATVAGLLLALVSGLTSAVMLGALLRRASPMARQTPPDDRY